MPRGIPKIKEPRVIKGKKIARDLVQDVARRVCTNYDSRTILRMLAPEDEFSIIIPERDLEHLLVPYACQTMEIADDLGDDELNKVAVLYRKAKAVIVKNQQE